MNSILSIILLVVALLGASTMLYAFAQGFHRQKNPVHTFLSHAFHAPIGFLRALGGSQELALANVAEGENLTGLKSFIADSLFGTRFRLGKIGSSNQNITIITAATDKPLAVVNDEAAAIGDLVSGAILGASPGTKKVAINSNVALGDSLTPDASGYARTLPTADGVYWVFGIALQAGVAGDVIEFAPCFPKQIQYATAVATTRL